MSGNWSFICSIRSSFYSEKRRINYFLFLSRFTTEPRKHIYSQWISNHATFHKAPDGEPSLPLKVDIRVKISIKLNYQLGRMTLEVRDDRQKASIVSRLKTHWTLRTVYFLFRNIVICKSKRNYYQRLWIFHKHRKRGRGRHNCKYRFILGNLQLYIGIISVEASFEWINICGLCVCDVFIVWKILLTI